MTKKSDTRILRIMAGALFASDLTPRQLRELADRLLFDDEWRARLSNIVRELATLPERNAWQYQADLLDQRAREFTELATDITDLLSRKRIPKAQALQILHQAAGPGAWKPDGRRTLRENALDLVRSTGSPHEGLDVLRRVRMLIGMPPDPYLHGLS